MNALERKKMVVAMEYIVRQINDEEVFFPWLMAGVADGDIPYGDFDISNSNLDYYVEDDDNFKELMDCFLRRMKYAVESGGLYCDEVVTSIG